MRVIKRSTLAVIWIAAATIPTTAGVGRPDGTTSLVAGPVDRAGLVIVDPDAPTVRVRPERPRRIALAIGNGSYGGRLRLRNAAGDAEAVGAALRLAGFDVVRVVKDASRAEMLGELRRFEEEAKEAEWAAVYYAGFGFGSDSDTLLVPIGVDPEDPTGRTLKSIPLSAVRATLDGVGRFGLVLIDTCRDTQSAPDDREPAPPPSAPTAAMAGSAKVLTAYAARPGAFAYDSSVLSPDHSPYAAALVRHIGTPGLDLATLFRRVQEDVARETGGRQKPEVVGQLPLEQLSFR